MSVLFFISCFYLVSFCSANYDDRKNRFSVKVNTAYKEKIEKILEGYTFSWLYEITPSTIIIEYRGDGQGFKFLKTLAHLYPDQIVSWEPVRVYVNELKPAQTYFFSKSLLSSKEGPELPVEDVGQYGYTGKGITIAISDVAINTDQLDLEDHINRKLSYNFVGQTSNVSTNSFEEEKNNDNNVEYTVASERGSGFCTTGIAYNASIAALKIYEVQPKRNRSELQPNYWTASDTLSRSLVYKLDEIYIFVNTWSPANPFEPLDLPMYEAIEYGAREGRRGLGTIYLVPAGSAGNGLSNNIHIITVGSIGQFGSLLYNAYIVVDASVITSGISDGTSFTSSRIPKSITAGCSASVSQSIRSSGAFGNTCFQTKCSWKNVELSAQSSDVEFSHRCAITTNEECVTVVEQAHVSLNLETNTTNIKVVIISPAGTESVLMDEGRRDLGTIYIVPTGATGNGFSNNIYTITVGGIGMFGTVPSDATVDASVITSGLTEGNNITAPIKVTVSQNNKCITTLHGISLATAQIAGIIALGIEANPYLSQRNILHLLVKASEKDGLSDSSKFQKNGAGLYAHAYFGFGLLNAMRFVELAERGISTPMLKTTSLSSENKRNQRDTVIDVLLCYQCSVVNEEHCVTNLEYIDVSMKLITDTGYLKITVISPSNTESLLMDDKIEERGFPSTIECSFVSVHFWDELPFGIWTIRIQRHLHYDSINVSNAKITVYGTHSVEMMGLIIKDDLCGNIPCLR